MKNIEAKLIIFLLVLFSDFLKILDASVQNRSDLIENSSAEKVLGVLLDNKLSMSQQCDLLAKKDNGIPGASGDHWQQVLGADSAPLFSPGEATSGLLCPVLGSVQHTVREPKHLYCTERLKELSLFSLKKR